MHNDMSIIRLVIDASLVVQLVMLLLLLASVASWAVIFQKQRLLKQARSTADSFEKEFWSGGDLTGLYRRISGKGSPASGMEGIFEAGFREFSRLRKQDDLQASQVVDGSRRAMLVSQMRESDRLEQNLAFLATVGSTSPYVGLFGTVWGIMNAFINIGAQKNASLDVVAPGIAEALIATAIGLVAAIPAVMAYNYFVRRIIVLTSEMESFSSDLLNIVRRHFLAG